jgi:hypothetical protein
MWTRKGVFIASCVGIILLAAGRAEAAGVRVRTLSGDKSAMLQRVHSVDEAEDTLYRRGYYDVRLERASLPYSFNACKRGVRYHIHVNYYGDLVQVDEVGLCGRDYDRPAYYGRRPYYERYRYYGGRDY